MNVCPESVGPLVLPSCALVVWVGVERGLVGEGLGLAHCWVLKHQLLVPPFVLLPRFCGGGGLVGLLFEICIVDASIKYTFRSDLF